MQRLNLTVASRLQKLIFFFRQIILEDHRIKLILKIWKNIKIRNVLFNSLSKELFCFYIFSKSSKPILFDDLPILFAPPTQKKTLNNLKHRYIILNTLLRVNYWTLPLKSLVFVKTKGAGSLCFSSKPLPISTLTDYSRSLA